MNGHLAAERFMPEIGISASSHALKFGLTADTALAFRTLNSDLAEVGDTVDAALGAALSRVPNRVGEDFADALRMSLTEALNNSIEHGYGGVPGNPIRIGLWRTGEKLVVGITDRGRPMPEDLRRISREPEVYDDLDSLPEGGWGWMLILNGVDNVHYERVGPWNCLFLEKSL